MICSQMSSIPRLRGLRRTYAQWRYAFQSDESRRALAIALTIVTFVLLVVQSARHISVGSVNRISERGGVELFIAIGSAPRNWRLRNAARETWLSWIPSDGSVSYRFFTDAPPSTRTAYASDARLWRQLAYEGSARKDIVQQPLPGGYGDNEHNAYGLRALFQSQWVTKMYPDFRYFLRIDDDSFLCLHRLLYELKSTPDKQFFWGRFWCRQGRNRADENFMLFSSDIVRTLADDRLTGKLLPFDTHVTLGWNFGYWSWILNLTMFDDQARIDAQQGYLTSNMHGDDVALNHVKNAAPSRNCCFCDEFIYAHHVPEQAMRDAFAKTNTHLMYPLPVRRSPRETCKNEDHSFIPARHSKLLPDLKIQPADIATDVAP